MTYHNICPKDCKTNKRYTQRAKNFFYLSILFVLMVSFLALIKFFCYKKPNISTQFFSTFTKKIVYKKRKKNLLKIENTQNQRIINKKNKIHEFFTPAASVINIYNPTNEFYIVIKNFIDYYLALDYAKELLEKNKKTVYIIKGQGVFDWNYVAIARFEQEEMCTQELERLNSDYDNTLSIKHY